MTAASESRGFPVWVLLGGVLLALAYLPTLGTRFDFIDDGNLVYPTRGLSLPARAGVVWEKIAANYDHLGPFRPVLWVHWELAADLLDGSEIGWRVTRLAWCAFAATMLLWLLAELGIPPAAALVAGAVAMWNPYRNEIWTSLTLAEGVAMPYALLALVAARRAPLSRRPILWDLLGAGCVLAALGCKNTFAALVPAQVFLRTWPDGVSFRDAWRGHGRRAVLLSLTLLAPAIHLAYFKLHWHPGQYVTSGPSVGQCRRIVSGLCGAMSSEFVGLGVAIAIVAQARSGATQYWMAGLLRRYRAALGAGALLTAGGVVMYLPMDAMSGRYTMPAVWGLDLMLAVALSGLPSVRGTRGAIVARVALAVGLIAILTANVGKQQKFAARADVLWQALEWVAANTPANTSIAWQTGDGAAGELNVEEGIHFRWHLAARGRPDVTIRLVDTSGRPVRRVEIAESASEPAFAIWGNGRHGPELQRWSSMFWWGWRSYEVRIGPQTGDSPTARFVTK